MAFLLVMARRLNITASFGRHSDRKAPLILRCPPDKTMDAIDLGMKIVDLSGPGTGATWQYVSCENF
jgi:hypothetical protein